MYSHKTFFVRINRVQWLQYFIRRARPWTHSVWSIKGFSLCTFDRLCQPHDSSSPLSSWRPCIVYTSPDDVIIISSYVDRGYEYTISLALVSPGVIIINLCSGNLLLAVYLYYLAGWMVLADCIVSAAGCNFSDYDIFSTEFSAVVPLLNDLSSNFYKKKKPVPRRSGFLLAARLRIIKIITERETIALRVKQT